MSQVEDANQDIIRFVLKAIKLTAAEVKKVIEWYLENKNDVTKFKEETGKVNMETLHSKTGSVKFIEQEIDKEEMKLISSEFKKYNVLFAVDKQEQDKYIIAFAGKNDQTVEYAMRQVIKKQDRLNRKSKIEEIKEKTIDPAKEIDTREKERSQTREDRAI
jgi:hypothetical protein